jgi:acetyl-CoA carboxylase carboxyl transferase subunit alpha
VISPEGAASILWRDSARAPEAAANLKITAQDLARLKIIDGIVTEPRGGAHRDREATVAAVAATIESALASLADLSPDEVRRARRDKFLAIGRNL